MSARGRARLVVVLVLVPVLVVLVLGCGLTCHPKAWLAGDPWCERVCAPADAGPQLSAQ